MMIIKTKYVVKTTRTVLHTEAVWHVSKPVDTVARDPVTWLIVGKSISGLTGVSDERVVDSNQTVWCGVFNCRYRSTSTIYTIIIIPTHTHSPPPPSTYLQLLTKTVECPTAIKQRRQQFGISLQGKYFVL